MNTLMQNFRNNSITGWTNWIQTMKLNWNGNLEKHNNGNPMWYHAFVLQTLWVFQIPPKEAFHFNKAVSELILCLWGPNLPINGPVRIPPNTKSMPPPPTIPNETRAAGGRMEATEVQINAKGSSIRKSPRASDFQTRHSEESPSRLSHPPPPSLSSSLDLTLHICSPSLSPSSPPPY